MMNVVLVALGAACAFARPDWRDLKNYTFEKFVADFKFDVNTGNMKLVMNYVASDIFILFNL